MKKIVLGTAAVATLLAAIFAPDDEGSIVGAATATTRQVERTPAPLTLAEAAAPSINPALAIPPRRNLDDDEEAATLFARQSWQTGASQKIMPGQQAATPAVAADPNAPP